MPGKVRKYFQKIDWEELLESRSKGIAYVCVCWLGKVVECMQV